MSENIPNENISILIVEDEPKIARFTQLELEHEGFRTSIEGNGRRAYERIIKEDYDVVLLDVMLPEMDGFEICQKVRELSDVPIIMLTARDDIEDKVNGLDIGADDYLTKPFAIKELLARIRLILRRKSVAQEKEEPRGEVLQVKNLKIIPAQYEVIVGNTKVSLTKKEYDLLEYLVRNKRVVLTREQILSNVWGYDYAGDTNVVDVYIRYLRSKLDDKFGEKYLHTMRRIGYVVKE